MDKLLNDISKNFLLNKRNGTDHFPDIVEEKPLHYIVFGLL